MSERDFSWVRMDLSHKSSLPSVGEWIMLYVEGEGYYFGFMDVSKDRAGRNQYYVYLGNRPSMQRWGNNRAVKGRRKIWWKPAPGIPFGAKE